MYIYLYAGGGPPTHGFQNAAREMTDPPRRKPAPRRLGS